MRIVKSLAIAFSIYSRIPMPRFSWEEEDMRHQLIFFPWVGMVIGGLEYLILWVLGQELPGLFLMLAAGLIPLLVTGGFHVDGFMDVQDALRSYRSREEKLEILKDPHVGAFSVISLLIHVLLYAGGLSLLIPYGGEKGILLFSLSFIFSRSLGALLMLRLKKARPDGMLQRETRDAGGVCILWLMLELILCAGLMLWVDPPEALAVFAAAALFSLYYRWKMYREFGGITGDTTGYFITVSELVELMVIGAWSFICR